MIDSYVEIDDVEKKPSSHSNFLALFYVWSVVILFLAGVGGAVYWFGVAQ